MYIHPRNRDCILMSLHIDEITYTYALHTHTHMHTHIRTDVLAFIHTNTSTCTLHTRVHTHAYSAALAHEIQLLPPCTQVFVGKIFFMQDYIVNYPGLIEQRC